MSDPAGPAQQHPRKALDPHRPRSGRAGTQTMVLGTVVSALGAYAFQVIGGRSLGEDAFAPVAVMWTMLFLGFTIFLIPVEQMVIRRLTLAGGSMDTLSGSRRVIGSVLLAATAAAVGFTILVRDALLGGGWGYVSVAGIMFLSHGLFVLGRGCLAGRRRFVAYGVAVGLDAVGKVAGAVVVAVAGLGPVALSWALVASPVLILIVRPFAAAPPAGGLVVSEVDRRSDVGFMTGFLLATAASQTVLAAGPLVVGALGASSAAISVFFVTTTLFRGPMSASYNLLARVLPFMTRSAAEGDHALLNRWALRLGIGGLLVACAGGAVASFIGPAVVEFLYGAGFRPPRLLAGLAAAGVIAGMVGLATTQILVARGETGRLAIVWVIAVAAAALAIVVVSGEPEIRVAAGFFSGEAVALVGLTLAVLASPRAGDRADVSEGVLSPPAG